MSRLLRSLLAFVAARPHLRRIARRMVASVPVLERSFSRLLARGQADMVAVAARRDTKPSGDSAGAAAGFEDRERLFRAARAIIARHEAMKSANPFAVRNGAGP